ncbi:MAG TPA: DNA gyrase inhibitor YacG [Usitatibacter sp.]|nr:DNA gyrase inhibitor YacG [Usitatibacter sp.]HST00979.1 DNA gyrase inhibitor YacG [Usitatibacter sp.]
MSGAQPGSVVACPACGKAVEYAPTNRWRPFCSERCRLSDLGGWASEEYRVPGAPQSPDAPAEKGELG